jgi:hypothetical protein
MHTVSAIVNQMDPRLRSVSLWQTSKAQLLYYSLEPVPSAPNVYRIPNSTSYNLVPFSPGPGEGIDVPGVVLRARGEVDMADEGCVAR